MKKVLFLDRDGVINRMVKYDHGWDSPQKARDVVLVEGIEKVIKWLNGNKILIIEVSNQPGVAKGKMSQIISDQIEDQSHKLLKEKGAFINKVYICPHHPRAIVPDLKVICECRKPKPGLLLQAAQELDIDLSSSVFLGDKASDVEAGKSVGCTTIIFIHEEDEEIKVEEAKAVNADYKIESIEDVLPLISQLFKLT